MSTLSVLSKKKRKENMFTHENTGFFYIKVGFEWMVMTANVFNISYCRIIEMNVLQVL